MADPVVGITNGVPTSGTGTITTLGMLLGTAGSPTTNVLTVQGITSMTPLKVDGSGVTQPVSGTVTAAQATAASLNATVVGTGTFAVQATLQASATTAIGKVDPNTIGSWGLQVATQNSATPTNGELVLGQFNTTPTTITSGNVSPLQLDNAGNLLVNIKAGSSSGAVAQGSTTSGQSGGLTQAAVTTGAPTYTTAQTSPLSLTTAGDLRSIAKITDGTNTATVRAGSSLPAASDTAVVVTNRDSNANGLALPANSAPVVIAPTTTDVSVTPAVTASAYSAGNVIGGVMQFAGALLSVGNNGILQSITAKFKGTAVTGSIEVAIFKANPSNGTYTDKTAPTWNVADMANLLGIYTLSAPNSKLGTMTVYNLDGIGKALVGTATSLWAVTIVDGTPTPASTSDFTLELSLLPG
jgi:hypothetical protein